jgi:hypothetical protein
MQQMKAHFAYADAAGSILGLFLCCAISCITSELVAKTVVGF